MSGIKILFITASHPPHHAGGYELRCKNIIDLLVQRGHKIKIITTKCVEKSCDLHKWEKNIHRQFHKEDPSKSLIVKIYRDYKDIKFFDKIVTSYQPDLILLGHIINLTRTIFPYLAESNVPIVFDEGAKGMLWVWSHHGPWFKLIERKSDSVIKNKLKEIIVYSGNKLSGGLLKKQWRWPVHMRGYFNSELNLRNALAEGLPVDGSPVIHSGVDINQFPFKFRPEIKPPIRIIVPGRIETRKGQIDAVLLLAYLRKIKIDASLIIVGKIKSISYSQEIIKEIKELNLGDRIKILPMVDHDVLATLYQEADICFFPSFAKTGFSRVPLEAMASGCLVFTYGHEGSDEIFMNNEIGFIVPYGGFKSIGKIIQNLVSDSKIYRNIINNARRVVEHRYSMEKYVDKIEAFLKEAIR